MFKGYIGKLKVAYSFFFSLLSSIFSFRSSVKSASAASNVERIGLHGMASSQRNWMMLILSSGGSEGYLSAGWQGSTTDPVELSSSFSGGLGPYTRLVRMGRNLGKVAVVAYYRERTSVGISSIGHHLVNLHPSRIRSKHTPIHP